MSQRLDILRYMAKGRSITALTALEKFNCLRLSGRVLELRAEGWPLQSKLVRVNGKMIARYWLNGAKS